MIVIDYEREPGRALVVTGAPLPFTLRQLQYAVAVADALSFRAAAQLCRVAQPSLSAQIAQLEDALGVRLFERDRRRVLVTPAGGELLTRARALLAASDDLAVLARQAGDPLAATLRLGVIPTVSPYLLPPLSTRLRRRHPRLKALWVEDKTDVLVSLLQAGKLDAALLALEADVGELDHEVIARDPFVLAMPSGHALARRSAPVKATQLRDADVLLLDEGHCFRTQALAFCARARAHELEFRATSLGTLAQMVAGGAGVTLLPMLAVATERRRAALEIRSFEAPVPKRTLALVWRPRSPLAAALRTLAETMRDAYPAEARAPTA